MPRVAAAAQAMRAVCVCLGVGAVAASPDSGAGPNGTISGNATAEAVTRRATFGGMAGLSGSISFRLVYEEHYEMVEWTTTEMRVPEQLIRDTCGSYPEVQNFHYSINSAWAGSDLHGIGQQGCGFLRTGGHWDPTAACSLKSGNQACLRCLTELGYKCDPGHFSPRPDFEGNFAYRFLNKHSCELGDLSGMAGELDAKIPANTTGGGVTIPAMSSPGYAQMSAEFGEISGESVAAEKLGINCDSSGPPPVHATDCGCVRYNGEHSPSRGTLTVFKPQPNTPWYWAGGASLPQLAGRSVVVRCGSVFGGDDGLGRPLFCGMIE